MWTILVHLDYFDLNRFEKFNAIFEDALQNHHFTTQKMIWGIDEFSSKTLETFNPFESLNHEQANTEQILDFRVIDFKLLCSSVKPAKTKTYERKDFDLFYADDFCKNYNTIIQKFLIEIYQKSFPLQSNLDPTPT